MTISVKSATPLAMTDRLAALRLQMMAGELTQRVGLRIRERREELGLNQREVADRMPTQVTNQHVSNWERGVNRPSERHLESLADALDVDIAYFLAPAEPAELPAPFFERSPEDRALRKDVEECASAIARVEAKLDATLLLMTEALRTPADDAERERREAKVREILDASADIVNEGKGAKRGR